MNTDIKNQHHILEAIDQLRRRKARPDIDRICNFVTKRFAVDSRDTKADLQRCVENSIVYKVEYKGSISYRNAAKKSYGQMKVNKEQQQQQHPQQQQQQQSQHQQAAQHQQQFIQSPQSPPLGANTIFINSPSFLENKMELCKLFANIVTTVVADLYLEDSDYLEFGVPLNDLVKKILTKHPSKFSKKAIIDLLQQEVDNGGLIKMDTGNYSLGPSSTTTTSTPNSIPSTPQENKTPDFVDDDDDYLTVNTSCDGSTPHLKIRKKPGPKPGKRKNDMEKLRSLEESSSGVGIRMGGRRKRAKKVFDPSDNNLPRNRKRGRPLGSLNKSTIEKQTAAMLTARAQGTTSVNSNYNSNSNASDVSPNSRPTSRASSTGPLGGGNSSCGSIGTGSILRDTHQGGVCSVCHLQGKKGLSDKMISCRECSNKAHVSCLNTDDGMLRMYPDNTWQCPHCKTCVVCYETSDAGALTVCQICADAYHSFCHEPKITDISKSGYKWVCATCQKEPLLSDIKTEIKQEVEEKEEKFSINYSLEQSAPSSPRDSTESTPYNQSPANSPVPPILSPQNTQNLQNGDSQNDDNRNSLDNTTSSNNEPRTRTNSGSDYKFYNMSDSQSCKDFEMDEMFDPSIPDASNWSYDDVYNYFVQYFPEEAIVFKEQEIDGHSLLLMKRVDVLTSLNLKLGPALKIYRHVLKLQVRRDDHKLYWL